MLKDAQTLRAAIRRPVASVGALAVLALLSACGGGGSSDPAKDPVILPGGGISMPPDDGDSTPAQQAVVTVAIVDQASGEVRNTVSYTTQSVARAEVKDAAGLPIPNVVVRFTSNEAGALRFSPAATALTDEMGRASVSVAPASISTAGAYTITASTQVGELAASAATNVAIGAPQVGLGQLAASTAPLSAYGTTVFSVPVTGVPSTTPVQVRFTSTCATQDPPRAAISQLVDAVNGMASATYVDRGCGGEDLVTATVEGTSIARAATLQVAAPAIANIQFASASPYVIAQRGTGGVQGPGQGLSFPEISTVRFQVVDQAGAPVRTPTNVTLRLSNNTGGLLIDQVAGPVVKQTDANGFVEVQVQSGTLPTPVWVIASIATPAMTLTTNSVQLAVSTGQPSQARFSLSFEALNCEGWSYDQECTGLGVIAADAMGNPVPDGSAISFVSEYGMVESNCQTGVATDRPLPGSGEPGRCRVSFFSQGTRPSDGRVGVVAYAVGEEHYEDWNGNNRYDVGEAFYDMGYLFIDRNESGAFEAGERFIPFLTAQSSTCASNSLPAVGTASVPGTCDRVWGRAHVRSEGVIIFSGSTAYFRTTPTFGAPNISNIPTTYSLGTSCSTQVAFWLQDLNGNPMPYDTDVVLDFGASTGLTVIPGDSQKVPSSNARGGTFHSFAISGWDPEKGCVGAGPVVLNVTTPRQNTTTLILNVTR